jgi:hypothetical protein
MNDHDHARSGSKPTLKPANKRRERRTMTTTAHTPGPWRYDCGNDGAVVYKESVGTIANVPDDLIHSEANARLIAAAPGLLKALETAEQAIEEATDIMYYEDGQPVTALEGWEIERAYLILCGVLVEVEQAIVEARGTQR